MEKKPVNAVIAGLIIAGICIAFSLITTLMGEAANRTMGWIQYLLIIISLMILIPAWGKANNHEKSFGELFGYGFKSTAIYTLIFLIFLAIFLYMQPELKEKSLQAAREAMEKQGSPDSEIETAMEMARKYYWIGVIGVTMFFLILIGVIGSLLGAAITKKSPRNPMRTIDHLDQPHS